MSNESGKIVGDRYRLIKRIGEGGQGVVYKASDLELFEERVVAVKIMNMRYFEGTGGIEGFRREIKALAMCKHNNIVDIRGHGVLPDGRLYLVLEYLDGTTLDENLRALHTIHWRRVIPWMIQLCNALECAHERNIWHRDIKPQNCMIVHTDERQHALKVLDLGIAKLVESSRLQSCTNSSNAGTLYFMAPERVLGQDYDHRVDVYSSGVMMYQLLTGRMPYPPQLDGFLRELQNPRGIPPSRVNPSVCFPDELDTITMRAMHRIPRFRYTTMREMRQDLETIWNAEKEAGEASVARSSSRRRLLAYAETAPSEALHGDVGDGVPIPRERNESSVAVLRQTSPQGGQVAERRASSITTSQDSRSDAGSGSVQSAARTPRRLGPGESGPPIPASPPRQRTHKKRGEESDDRRLNSAGVTPMSEVLDESGAHRTGDAHGYAHDAGVPTADRPSDRMASSRVEVAPTSSGASDAYTRDVETDTLDRPRDEVTATDSEAPPTGATLRTNVVALAEREPEPVDTLATTSTARWMERAASAVLLAISTISSGLAILGLYMFSMPSEARSPEPMRGARVAASEHVGTARADGGRVKVGPEGEAPVKVVDAEKSSEAAPTHKPSEVPKGPMKARVHPQGE